MKDNIMLCRFKVLKIKSIKSSLLIVLLVVFFAPKPANAQDSDLGNWLIYIGNKKINEKWNIHHEVQYRNYNVAGDLEQLLLRTGIGYNISENSNILLGYGYILSENYIGDSDDKVSVNEHRIFQQFITKQNIGKVGLSHRYRFEQRFVEDDFKMRLRYFLGVNIPLQYKEDAKNPFYLSMYNEIFLNTEASVFDRNRVYGGLGYKFSKNLRLEFGYMNQFFETSGRDQINLIVFASF